MKKLEKISETLDKNTFFSEQSEQEDFLIKIAEVFKTKNGSHAEAKGITVEQVVRVAILKQMYQLSYEKLFDELNDNLSYSLLEGIS